jgi:hypothetical protein
VLGKEDEMIIDCDTCVMDGTSACADCIVPVLLAGTGGRIEVGAEETAALRNLSDAGMVAPLRLVRRDPDQDLASGEAI